MTEDTKTLTLTEFLLARIAQDEAEMANAIKTRHPGLTIQRNPSRFAAECEAKRRIVDFATRLISDGEDSEPWAGEEVLALLAAVYADHPDYDESWRP